ncbi:31488_t:CDS:1, partial [Racocetra persica]
ALPFEVVSKTTQILSPSLILPSTVLFMLQVLTSDKPHLKKNYKITVQQSKYLMQKSALFDKLSTQFAQLASNTSLNSDSIEEANGLPMLCIEAPVHGGLDIVDASLDWLYASADIKDVLTSSLASKIRTYQDFFSLLNFTTLLDLYEPFRGAVDQILVYYYFGLSVEERRVGILSNHLFVEGVIPGNFVKRLAESVNEDAAKEILISFFRGKQLKSLNDMNEDEVWEELSLDDDMGNESPTKRANILDWINSTTTPTPRHVSFSVPNTPLTASLDHAEPPTPLGSAYFRSLPNIQLGSIPHPPKSVKFKQMPISNSACIVQNGSLRENLKSVSETGFVEQRLTVLTTPSTPGMSNSSNTPNTPSTPSTPNTPNTPDKLVASPTTPSTLVVPPNTPSFLTTVSTRNGLLSPPTLNTPTIQENHDTITSPPLANSPKVKTPTTPTIVIMDSDLQIEKFAKKDYSFIRRELFENALNKMRRRPLYFK